MKQLRRLLSSPAVTVGAFALAACLLAFSTIGGTRAALTYYSENYVSTVQMHELGVSLVENGAVVATGNAVTSARAARDGEQMSALLGTLILEQSGAAEPASEPFKLGAVYREQLAVHNPKDNGADAAAGAANITQYVRVTIRRYWVKPRSWPPMCSSWGSRREAAGSRTPTPARGSARCCITQGRSRPTRRRPFFPARCALTPA